jgi:hypothetical protein
MRSAGFCLTEPWWGAAALGLVPVLAVPLVLGFGARGAAASALLYALSVWYRSSKHLRSITVSEDGTFSFKTYIGAEAHNEFLVALRLERVRLPGHSARIVVDSDRRTMVLAAAPSDANLDAWLSFAKQWSPSTAIAVPPLADQYKRGRILARLAPKSHITLT